MKEVKEDNLSRKLGRFWRTLFLTEDGRPKSTVLLYSFALSFLFLAIYAAAYAFLLRPIQSLVLPGYTELTPEEIAEFGRTHASTIFWVNVLESILPGLVGSAVCCGISLLIKERAIPAGAYIWLVVFLVVILIALIFVSRDPESETYRFYPELYKSWLVVIILPYVPAGLLSGTIFTHHRYGVYRRARLRKERELAEKEKEQS